MPAEQTENVFWTSSDIKEIVKDYLLQNLKVRVQVHDSYVDADVYLDGDIISSSTEYRNQGFLY